MKFPGYLPLMNNKKTESERNNSEINLRTNPGTSGTADIRLRISSPYNLLQFTGKASRVIFGI